MKLHRIFSLVTFFLLVFYINTTVSQDTENKKQQALLSQQTKACIGCHKLYTPGIVEDWLTSRHAGITPSDALKKPVLKRRISSDTIPDELIGYAIGCYECHSQNPDKHPDNFQHMGYKVNIVVSPDDCKTCHSVEAKQYSGSKKAYAFKNLMGNPLFEKLVVAAASIKKKDNGIISQRPSEKTLHETCLSCHGTKIHVQGTKNIYFGDKIGTITVPDLANWPNQGVGRENPDGSLGSCASCHTRHSFSIEVARKPYTCAQCHLEPDVPAWNVFKESKHGNIYFSQYHEWNFTSVPWTIGRDFKTPTCATCHNSLIVVPNGKVIVERNHDFGSRLWVRIFGLIYTHPQPKSGDTTIIRNTGGVPLPADYKGAIASDYLITESEQSKRLNIMKGLCKSCHSTQWVNKHFEKLENTITETDEMVLTTTKLMSDIWETGLEDNVNPFNESMENMWLRQWFFYANSIRYASAMTGAPDYTTFKNGWWNLNENLQRMIDWTKFKKYKGRQ